MKVTETSVSELNALLGLIDEPDEDIFDKVRKRILVFGKDAVKPLEEELAGVNSQEEYYRIEALIDELVLNDVISQISEWKNSRKLDVADAWISVSEFLNRDIDKTAIRELVFDIFKDIWLEINENLTALEKIKVINHILYKIHGFTETENSGETVMNYVIDSFLQYKSGNSLSMGMFYLAMAQRLGLPVFGVDLPHHFILGYVDEHQKIKPAHEYTPSDVMFYINPFNGGAVFTKTEIDLYLKQYNIKSRPLYYTPADNITVIRRYLNELKQIWEKEDNRHKILFIDNLCDVLM